MFRLLSWLFGLGAFAGLVALGGVSYYVWMVSRDLPDYTVLQDYQPAVTTRVHAADGTLLAEYAIERRLFQPIGTIPPKVIDAFLAAEDANFYDHFGIDLGGVVRAMRDNVLEAVDGGSGLVGASTITQQVAKNFLLTSDQTWDRKIREAILALRIEDTLSKDEILELYLNEIYLGMGSYGVAAAALNYFDKALYELDYAEIAYLAALPKGPTNYHPFRRPEAAIERRNWVLDRMVETGALTAQAASAYKAENLNVIPRQAGSQLYSAEYFTEEVRRQIASLYGSSELYEGGLSVRTSLDPQMQLHARRALMEGLIAFDQRRGFHGVEATIELGEDWGLNLAQIQPLTDVPEWTLAVILATESNSARIGLRPIIDVDGRVDSARITGQVPGSAVSWISQPLGQVLSVGDVVYVEPVAGQEGIYTLRQVPEIEGGIVAMDPRTGRVLALVGGFSFAESEFNRATQAMRQPGSAFKPLVYAAALDNGYTPASVVLDAPLRVVNADGSVWQPENYARQFYGPQTLRRGIELSRNVMTVRLAQDLGMPMIEEYARLFGVYEDMPHVLAMALGAGETTVLRLTAAYATMANGGRRITPTLIDRIQDRYGDTIYRHDERICDGCDQPDWHGQGAPLLIDSRQQVLDPMTAYQITSMMEGVVQRGTGTALRALGRPVAGKTGTTNDYKDAWFVGFTPELAVGVYVGYDTPRSMGSSSTGGELAAPVVADFLAAALEGVPASQFTMPQGMHRDWIDPRSGVEIVAGGSGIQEAFKPGTGPNARTSVIGLDSAAFDNIQTGATGQPSFGTGGLF
ncbi:penicillin-binding protein 1A [Pelagibacterium lacus]|uniref:Penicillin-binding protein 1A n=1 Tax=Pelagibacterium lacus TaxID=2282655 RepID=A0A369W5U3_9HYPH|nr:penicillin-binding protein 1A [Pelagibacterium lacus]RDE09235.1 penicillin-binding protein 1A [Pelagibacterium lacus]